ncbi:hypothetical protein COU58_02400 [Candidatus Pacearchaeota archaeon CG10_big_fil_rev_8_21_14_0_10_32_42]|nr:MAG: hypothetical protein COU58_02400 [Candidatus Pacearchaeota archaeon CG10_big_fil_rev_8_21_14_0_10_32_42]
MSKTNKKNKDEGEISADWFEDHESYDEEEDNQKEEISEEDLEELEENIEEDEKFSSRIRHFLANQRKDVSLEKMVEPFETKLEDNFMDVKREEIRPDENNFDYMTGNKIEGMKYQTMEPDTQVSKPDFSSAERVLEEQKALYSNFKSTGGHMVENNKSEWNSVTPEETKKDYLTKRRME